VALFEVPD